MFAKTIIDSDAFIDMPVTARLLYYDLSMRADDDGFVNSPKKIMRMVGASQDDLKILIAKKFIIPFDNGVVVIKHWKIHNYIRKDTYNETPYKEEKALLELDENNAYRLTSDMNEVAVENTSTERGRLVDGTSTQDRLGKDSIGKVKGESKSSSRMTRPTIEEVQAYITEKGYHVDAQRFIDYYESNGWKVGRNPMKDWKATVRTWENRDKQDKKNNAPANNKKFRNFEEREYDYDSLEKQLLSKRRG
jgi:hypothetical protein